jgi:hypothetical protein
MTIEKLASAFKDATLPGSPISPTAIGKELRWFGSDALSSPVDIFMSHEWVNETHLRPQTHAHAWLGAVSAFGPLFHHHDALYEQVVGKMFSSEDEDSLNDSTEVCALVDHIPDSVTEEKQLKKRRIQGHINQAPDDTSAAAAPAGAATLQQQKLIGNDRQHQLRYDVHIFVQPSQEADKIMIAAAKKFFTKAKEMDNSLVIYPWCKSSK